MIERYRATANVLVNGQNITTLAILTILFMILGEKNMVTTSQMFFDTIYWQ